VNPETLNLVSLGECDPELEKKIKQDIETVVADYLMRHMDNIGYQVIAQQQSHIERMTLKVLKNLLDSAPNLY
jgi:hypothetical protein